MLCTFAWMACYGLLLIGPGPASFPLRPGWAALILNAALTLLMIAAWRRQGELGRTLSHVARG